MGCLVKTYTMFALENKQVETFESWNLLGCAVKSYAHMKILPIKSNEFVI